MNRVHEWSSRRLETLRWCEMMALTPVDVTDDRLADVLRLLSNDDRSRAFEQEVMGNLLRLSQWKTRGVRLDTTTVSSSADMTDRGVLPLGQSKDHRPDLPPLGVPLAPEVLAGGHTDDAVGVPLIDQVQKALAQTDVLSVGRWQHGSGADVPSARFQCCLSRRPIWPLGNPARRRKGSSHLHRSGR